MTDENEQAPTAALSGAEQVRARVDEATEALNGIAAEATQREWLILTTKLDRTREEIFRDGGLKMLALGWIKEKHAHGGADLDRLLDMTDAELMALHGFPSEDEIKAANAELAKADA